jgi:4-amino-4-deoxy-L-arabinose transferase-like glycosyltransferase
MLTAAPLARPPRPAAAAPAEGAWVRRSLGLIAGLAGFRLAWLWLMPLDLVPDEAYYWDWGRQPAWCYFSKPPMIAWLNTLTQALGFTTAPLMRTPAVVLGTIGLGATWLLARRVWGERAGFFAVVLGATAPGSLALNSLLTIDAPLIACWSVALYALWRALEPAGATQSNAPGAQVAPSADQRTGWWALYALAGLLGVLSKQMMLILPLLALVFVFTSPAGSDRAWRRRGAVYFWLALPLLALVPLLWWNVHHDWITLQHTAHHFEADPWRPGKALNFCVEFIGSQLGVIGPVAAVIGVVAACGWREVRADRRQWFAWTMTVPALALILAMSLRQRINPNWPAVFHLGGVLLAVGWLVKAQAWPRRRAAWRAAWISGLSIVALGYALVLAIGPLGLTGHKLDFTRRLRGWEQFGADVGAIKAKLEADGGAPVIVVTYGGRQLASELAFYLPGQPTVWRWTPPGGVDSQYALWQGPLPKWRGARVLLVTSADELPAALTSGLGRLTPLSEIHSTRTTALPPHLRILVGDNLQAWDHGKPL